LIGEFQNDLHARQLRRDAVDRPAELAIGGRLAEESLDLTKWAWMVHEHCMQASLVCRQLSMSGTDSAQAARREQINAGFMIEWRAAGGFPSRAPFLCEEFSGTAPFADQTRAVVTDPDLTLGPDQCIELAVDMDSMGSARPDVLELDHSHIITQARAARDTSD
jgi:hypothetical protein